MITVVIYLRVTKVEPLLSMVKIPAGDLRMGDLDGSGDSDEQPVHEVFIPKPFMMSRTEVTQGQWKEVMGNNPSHFSICGNDCPVENVSWNDAQEFIGRLNKKTGQHYRLPTEAEWEYAARSGGKKEKYSGGGSIGSVAWFKSNSGGKTHPVGTKAPNGLGIYDMSGNIWEWCGDWYGADYYQNSPGNNPTGPSSGSVRVIRGGSWINDAEYLRVSSRYGSVPDSRSYGIGFRCAQDFK
ncbi:formylglycine-generating enzyme family protein [Thermodesulfobacteriota bacterium]